MRLIRSNHTEELAEALAACIADDPLDPFELETIVVPSRGVGRWLTLALAERLGVWGNPNFPFPRSAIERALEALDLGSSEQSKAYDPSRLKWTIADLLLDATPAELETYLGSNADPDRVLRLATRLAAVFDRYVVYRSDLLRGWEAGHDSQWQARLWRQISDRLGPYDIASRIVRGLGGLRARAGDIEVGFSRLHLFSLESLPPVFLRFFEALSATIPMHLYLLAPTSEYVSNVDERGQLSLAIDPEPSQGHRLLTSLGTLARDFQELLLQGDARFDCEEDRFVASDRKTLLTSLQDDILHFRSRPRAPTRQALHEADDSIEIHACTSPMREVLVLHDVIREALERDHSLRPEDIVVLTPDLETYAPAFRAVFGQRESHPIPFEVHDRRTRDDSGFYEEFLAVLDVLESRFSVLDVVRLMDARSWKPELRFSPSERSRLTELLEAAGVRWGIDAAHREDLGFPREGLHTWRTGLGRLFLGFASMPDENRVFRGLLSRGEPSLEDAELLARLSRLGEVLFEFHRDARQSRTVAQWVAALGELAAALFGQEEEPGGALRVLRSSLERLREEAVASDFGRPIPLRTIHRELARAVEHHTPATGFLRRGLTLSELIPLRSIPFRMVCLIGMNESAFPRSDDRPSFDLTRAQPRPGDRSRRHDDCHSFLQALLGARDRLVVTYSSDVTGTRHAPAPSPIVWELLEVVDDYYSREGADSSLVPFEHPMHAFDPAYFEESAPFSSFSKRHLRIAQELAQESNEPTRFELLAEPGPMPEVLSVRDLAQWLWHPTREFIQRRLQVRLEDSTLYEPAGALTELAHLDAFRLGNDALRFKLRGAELRSFLGAAPEFPDGSWGEADQQELAVEVEALLDRRAENTGRGRERARIVSVDVGALRLEERLDGLYDDKRVKHRFNRAETKTELTTWLEHLLMQASSETDLPSKTELYLRATGLRAHSVVLSRVEDARAQLASLVDLYIACQSSPVALLNRASWTFGAVAPMAGVDTALEKAKQRQRSDHQWDRYTRFVWGQEGPFSDPQWAARFGPTSLRVYEPLLRHRSVQ